MAKYIMRDVRKPGGVEVWVDLVVRDERQLVAIFMGAFGTQLCGDFMNGARRRGDRVEAEDGTVMVGDVGELKP